MMSLILLSRVDRYRKSFTSREKLPTNVGSNLLGFLVYQRA